MMDWSESEIRVMNEITDHINSNKDIPLSAYISPLLDIAIQIIIREFGKEEAQNRLLLSIELLDKTADQERALQERIDNPPNAWPPHLVDKES